MFGVWLNFNKRLKTTLGMQMSLATLTLWLLQAALAVAENQQEEPLSGLAAGAQAALGLLLV